MTVAASKVRSVCTSSEAELVRASRKPELEQLSHVQVKRLTARARKLCDKWQDLGHGQARSRSRQVGSGEIDPNTALKSQIFRDALTNFEARLAKLDASADSPSAKTSPKTKKDRAVDHRASRSAIRKGMTVVEDLLNRRERKK